MRQPIDAANTDALLDRYAKTGDVAIRNEIVKRHLYIAESAARRYSGRSVDTDDLFQAASLALIQAVDRYKVDKGAKFSTFATATVLGVIKNYFRDHARNIRMPRKAGELLPRIEKARDDLSAELLRTPTPAQIAEHLGVEVGAVLEALEAQSSLIVASLDAAADEEKDGRLLDTVGAVDDAYGAVEFRDFLAREIDNLSGTERFILGERYWNGRSQRDIAREMNVSQMYVSRTERRIVERFRKAMGC